LSKKERIQLNIIDCYTSKIEFLYEIYKRNLFNEKFYSHAYSVLNIPFTEYTYLFAKEENKIWKFIFANIGLSILCLAFRK